MQVPHTAMIFAAGKGKRMAPLTHSTPKPLINVNRQTMLEKIVRMLVAAGVREVVINTHHLAQMMKAYIEQHLSDLPITIVHERDLLGTGGGLLNAFPAIGDHPFIAVNSDILPEHPMYMTSAIAQLCRDYDEDMDFLALLQPLKNARGYDKKGDFNMAEDGTLIKHITPDGDAPLHDYVFTGVRIIHPRLLQRWVGLGKAGQAFEFFKLLYKRRRDKQTGRIKGAYGSVTDNIWWHIDRPEVIEQYEQNR